MAEMQLSGSVLSLKARIIGTGFLVFQILFALNNYGPHRVPLLNLVFDKPLFAPNSPSTLRGEGKNRLEDVSASSGFSAFYRTSFNDDIPRYVEVMGGGVAVGDFDGDGWEDVFVTSMPSFLKDSSSTPSSLFRNQGDGTFVEMTKPAGLSDIRGYSQGALFSDFDNDGDQDLYVAAYDGGQFFRNEGGRFWDFTGDVGLELTGKCGTLPCFGSAAASADYDRDGFLDLLLVMNVSWDINNPEQQGRKYLFPAFVPAQNSLLYRNNGDGTFTDVTESSGLNNQEGKGLSAVWTDINNDGWPDVFIANDLSRNTLYLNQGDGTFMEIAGGAGIDEIKSNMGVVALDFDHDGLMDLASTNLKGSKISLFKNQGGLRFDYATNYSGLTASGRSSGWGIASVDLDLDGHTDLVTSGGPVWEREPRDTQNLVFRNLGNGQFEDVSDTSGDIMRSDVTRGLVITDFDRDGIPDLFFSNVDGGTPLLLKNHPPADPQWLKVTLEGTTSNRDAVGARVELHRADGLRIVEEVRAGGSYQSTSTRSLFFGLGKSSPEMMVIHWPSGKVDSLNSLPVNQDIRIREGDLEPVVASR